MYCLHNLGRFNHLPGGGGWLEMRVIMTEETVGVSSVAFLEQRFRSFPVAFVELYQTQQVLVVGPTGNGGALSKGNEERRGGEEAVAFPIEVEAPVPLGAGHDVPCLLLQAKGFGTERLIVGQLPQVHVAEELNLSLIHI